jgi:crotonobetainyl-CoA:carnitine CoA-transferase CaiB-like acyl-CoA transferase
MTNALNLLEQLRQLGGLPVQALRRMSIKGGDPVVRTPLRAAETGAASIAACGMAASWLWSQSHGSLQDVSVDALAATAAMQSYKFLKINGQPPGSPMDKLTNSYQLKDGRWFYLHCNFPSLAEKNCRALGAERDAASMAAAALKWDGPKLEQAIFEAGGVGAFVRSEAEWHASPQGIAATQEPALEIIRIGDAAPEPLTAGDRPLSGVRVLDLTRVLAGPTCAKHLAEHGADVLKISRKGLADSGILDLDTGLGKLSTFLDMGDAAQLQNLRDLIKDCDVFSQAYRPGTLAERGLSPQDLAQLRPGIVYVTLNAWGFDGPWSDRRGYDTVVQAANGMAYVGATERPVFTPVAQQDYVAGYLMAYGAMVALSKRVAEGGSWLVRVSLAGVGEWIRKQGSVAESAYEALPTQVPKNLVQPWLQQSNSFAGELTHLGPVISMSDTPLRWARPVVELGSSRAVWPERSPTL